MEVRKDVVYEPEHGERGLLDIHLPEGAENAPIVMVIHGGGLRALIKERMTGVSDFVAEQGWVAVNVNYRLLPDNPYPAPLMDTLAAFEWLQRTEHEDLARQDRSRVALLGASAGAFLVSMMGLILERENVRSVVAISGPATRRRTEQPAAGHDPRLFGTPIELARPDAPPFLCTHSTVDGVVDHSESVALVEALQSAGAEAELYSYEGPDELHGIWLEQNAPMPKLLPHLEHKIAHFLHKTL